MFSLVVDDIVEDISGPMFTKFVFVLFVCLRKLWYTKFVNDWLLFHVFRWVQVYLCFDHKEHAEASLSSLKSTQVKSMPLEVQYMYEDDADFEEVKGKLSYLWGAAK